MWCDLSVLRVQGTGLFVHGRLAVLENNICHLFLALSLVSSSTTKEFLPAGIRNGARFLAYLALTRPANRST